MESNNYIEVLEKIQATQHEIINNYKFTEARLEAIIEIQKKIIQSYEKENKE